MEIFNHCIIPSPIGDLCLSDDGQSIVGLSLAQEGVAPVAPTTALQLAAAQQITDYFSGKKYAFDLPIRLIGTEFEQQVWHQLQQIPYGATRTYGAIATALGRSKAPRAVGGACHRNPILLLVPCHRVVGKNGSLTGFACGLAAKKILLDLEQKR